MWKYFFLCEIDYLDLKITIMARDLFFLFCNMQGMIVPHFRWWRQFLFPDCHIFPVVSNAEIKAYQWQWLGRSLVWCSLCIVVHCKQWRFWSLSHVKSTDVHMDKVLLVFMNIFPCRKDFFNVYQMLHSGFLTVGRIGSSPLLCMFSSISMCPFIVPKDCFLSNL